MKKVAGSRLIVEHIPIDQWKVAEKRVTPIVDHCMRYFRDITIGQMAVSCYTQGMMDCLQLVETSRLPVVLPTTASRHETSDFPWP